MEKKDTEKTIRAEFVFNGTEKEWWNFVFIFFSFLHTHNSSCLKTFQTENPILKVNQPTPSQPNCRCLHYPPSPDSFEIPTKLGTPVLRVYSREEEEHRKNSIEKLKG